MTHLVGEYTCLNTQVLDKDVLEDLPADCLLKISNVPGSWEEPWLVELDVNGGKNFFPPQGFFERQQESLPCTIFDCMGGYATVRATVADFFARHRTAEDQYGALLYCQEIRAADVERVLRQDGNDAASAVRYPTHMFPGNLNRSKSGDRPLISSESYFLGPKFTHSSIHHDNPHGHAWVAVQSGCKRMLLVPQSATADMESDLPGFVERNGRCKQSSQLFFDLSRLTPAIVDQWLRPWNAQLVDIKPGQLLFIPAGYWHQAYNMSFCVSRHDMVLLPEHLPNFARDWDPSKAQATLEKIAQEHGIVI